MTDSSFVSIVVGLIITVPLGNFAGVYAGDMVIQETFKVFDQCETNPEKFWKETCDEIKETFEDTIKKNERTKGFYQFVGIMIPVGVAAFGIVRKLS